MVKMHDLVKIEGEFESEALRVLREIPGIEVGPLPAANNADIDAIIEFAGRRKAIAVQFRQRANAANAWQLVHYAEAHPEVPLLIIAGESTAESRTILTRHGIALVDGLGNAHIELPGLLLHIEGSSRGRQTGKPRPPRLGGKSGVVAQALLIHPDRKWRIMDLAKEAAVSTGLAHRVLARLEDNGVVATEGAGPNKVRRVVDPSALLDLWAEEEKSRPIRTPGYLLAQTPQQLIEKLARGFERARLDHALTGAAAANIIAPFVTAVPVVELWVSAFAAARDLHKDIGSEPVKDGANIILLQQNDDTPLAFREYLNGIWISNRFRIYVDLLRDPRRGRDQAQHLRGEVIGI
jgi:hypothetical protein